MNYRVTKYNPAYRNEKGWYMRDEWTDYSVAVKTGMKSEYDEYKRVEDLYIRYLHIGLQSAADKTFTINWLERYKNGIKKHINHLQDCNKELLFKIRDNYKCSIAEVEDIARFILRMLVWCTFDSMSSYVDFGYDYYMFVGGVYYDDKTIKDAALEGIYIEQMDSPMLYRCDIEYRNELMQTSKKRC